MRKNGELTSELRITLLAVVIKRQANGSSVAGARIMVAERKKGWLLMTIIVIQWQLMVTKFQTIKCMVVLK